MRKNLASIVLLAALPAIADAHGGMPSVGDWTGGLLHPLGGLDHLLTAIGIGILAVADRRGTWRLPALFLAAMPIGGYLGFNGIPLPGMEFGAAASASLVGVAIAGGPKPSSYASALAVVAFALCHGGAHGAESAPGANFLAYAGGFATGTALLHLVGIGLGRSLSRDLRAYRALGAALGGIGLMLAIQAV